MLGTVAVDSIKGVLSVILHTRHRLVFPGRPIDPTRSLPVLPALHHTRTRARLTQHKAQQTLPHGRLSHTPANTSLAHPTRPTPRRHKYPGYSDGALSLAADRHDSSSLLPHTRTFRVCSTSPSHADPSQSPMPTMHTHTTPKCTTHHTPGTR